MDISIERLKSIVGESAKLMMSDTFEITQKEGYSNIVTSADIAVQEFLRTTLANELPDSGFICEEEELHDTSHEYTWIIDPIDGTANFSRGIDQCAICVGLKRGDNMEMSVVYLPRTQEMFYAERGKGAWLNGSRIHVSDRPFSNAILCTALPVYHKEYARVCSEIIVDTFMQCNDIRRFGAAAPEICYIAMGRCELYFEYVLSPWDFAAASLILSEAGGCITGLDGNPLNLTGPSGVLAANTPDNLEHLISIVQNRIGC